MAGKMGKGYRSRQVKGKDAPEAGWSPHAGKQSSGDGEKGYARETGCDQNFFNKGGGDPSVGGGSTEFDRQGPDLYKEGPMPEKHTSKDH